MLTVLAFTLIAPVVKKLRGMQHRLAEPASWLATGILIIILALAAWSAVLTGMSWFRRWTSRR